MTKRYAIPTPALIDEMAQTRIDRQAIRVRQLQEDLKEMRGY